MNARLVALAVAWLLPAVASAQHFHQHLEATPDDPERKSVCDETRFAQAQPDDGIRKVSWKVYTTGGDDALRYFQQGMTLLYGFNYEDALRNFKRALDFDGDFPMAYWGKAMAAAPNINLAQDSLCGKMARQWSLQAQQLANDPKRRDKVSLLEREIIEALVARYSDNPTDRVQAVAYAVAMRRVWSRWRQDPNAPNVAAVFTEALLNLRPWALYDNDQREAIGTSEVQEVLWSVLGAQPSPVERQPIGANHLWIHTVEASAKPESAEGSADFLSGAVPSSGHLLHMPSHIYLLMGDYARAAAANKKGIDVDRGQFAAACVGTDPDHPKQYDDYIKDPKCLPLYYGHYLAHNLYFRAVANAFRGKFTGGEPEPGADFDARAARKHVQLFVANEPGLQRYMTAWLMLTAADGDWGAILREELVVPDEKCYSAPFTATGCHILRSMWYWAKGMAYTSTQPPDFGAAREKLDAFRAERDRISQSGPTGWGNNSATAVLAIAEEVLRARLAWAENKRDVAIEHLQLAVSHEDNLAYDEPPQWMYPVRQSLGGAYLAQGGDDNYFKAKQAFCGDLARHRKNGRSLYGLYRALEGLKDPRCGLVKKEYLDAWALADDKHKPLNDGMLWLHGWPGGSQVGSENAESCPLPPAPPPEPASETACP